MTKKFKNDKLMFNKQYLLGPRSSDHLYCTRLPTILNFILFFIIIIASVSLELNLQNHSFIERFLI